MEKIAIKDSYRLTFTEKLCDPKKYLSKIKKIKEK